MHEYRDSCLICFSETWFQDVHTTTFSNIDGFHCERNDRSSESGKKSGGGVCMYVNQIRDGAAISLSNSAPAHLMLNCWQSACGHFTCHENSPSRLWQSHISHPNRMWIMLRQNWLRSSRVWKGTLLTQCILFWAISTSVTYMQNCPISTNMLIFLQEVIGPWINVTVISPMHIRPVEDRD